jgi:hypothetical protein
MQTRPEPPTNQETSVEKAVISKNTSMRKTATPPLPSVPAKRKLSISHSNESVQQTKPVRSKASPSTSGPARPQPVSIKSQVEPAHQNQVFYALSSDTRQTGRRTTGLSYTAASVARAGRPFRNLSHQNVSAQSDIQFPIRWRFTRVQHKAGYIVAGSHDRAKRDVGCSAAFY